MALQINKMAEFSIVPLVPFFLSLVAALYCALVIPREEATFISIIFKCFPTFYLSLYVRAFKSDDEDEYAQKILLGLLASFVGDIFLVAGTELFFYAVIAYSIAQVFYINAIGFEEPMYWPLGYVIYAANVGVLIIIMPGMLSQDIWLTMGVTGYSFLLMTMIWRAWARCKSAEELANWSVLWGAIGGLFFAISDLIVGLDFFYSKIDYAEFFILGSYFIAELGLALSIFERY